MPAAPNGSVLVVGVGASRGLGAAIARRFAQGGHPIAIAGRNAPKLAATAAELEESGADLVSVVGDASSAVDARRFVEAAQSLAPLAVAVQNAGSNRPAPFLKISQDQFEGHWREHVLGGFQLAQAALPALLESGGGTLIFTGASGSLRGKANFAPFASAKAGLRAMAQSIAREFGPKGVHVGHVVIDGGIAGERLLSAPGSWRSAVQTGCWISPPSPMPIGCCISSTAAPGRSNSTCGRGSSPSRGPRLNGPRTAPVASRGRREPLRRSRPSCRPRAGPRARCAAGPTSPNPSTPRESDG